jgi:hypothetical protein
MRWKKDANDRGAEVDGDDRSRSTTRSAVRHAQSITSIGAMIPICTSITPRIHTNLTDVTDWRTSERQKTGASRSFRPVSSRSHLNNDPDHPATPTAVRRIVISAPRWKRCQMLWPMRSFMLPPRGGNSAQISE